MKKLQDKISLVGEYEKITISEFRKNPGEIFTQTQLGKTFEITKNGIVIAQIRRPDTFDFIGLQRLRKAANY
jgi:hypothetical protein